MRIYAICAFALLALSVLTFILMLFLGKRGDMAKLSSYLKRVNEFTAAADKIDDDNLTQFEASCFETKYVPEKFKNGWDAFKGARFGYPSDYFDKAAVIQSANTERTKKTGAAFLVAFYVLSFVLLFLKGVIVKSDSTVVKVALLCNLAAVASIPWFVFFGTRGKKVYKKAVELLDDTMDLLDAKVQMQRYHDYQLDVSQLDAVISTINDVIYSEESKPIPSKKDLLDKAAAEAATEPAPETPETEASDGGAAFEVTDEASETPETETSETPETSRYMESEPVSYGYLSNDEEVLSPEYVTVEKAEPVKKTVDFNKFNAVLNQIIDGGYSRATYLKVAKLMIVAFNKFTEPEQRDALKQSIRRLIAAYRAAV